MTAAAYRTPPTALVGLMPNAATALVRLTPNAATAFCTRRAPGGPSDR
jgi:hypothetical protein